MNKINLLTAKIGSLRTAIVALLIVWLLAYAMGLGRILIENPISFLTALPISILLGWIILPQNLLYNLFGLTYESTPMWMQWMSILGYWMTVLFLTTTFLVTRRWFVLLVLAAVILTSTKGCMVFVDEYGGEMG